MRAFLACLFCFLATTASAMDYVTAKDPQTGRRTLYASGEIRPDELNAFAEAIASTLALTDASDPWAPLVVLDSGGGSPFAAMDIGRLIRSQRLDTIVPSGGIGCHSACTLAFLGGVKRRVEGDFGIHAVRIDSNGADVAAADAMQQGFDLQWVATQEIAYGKELIGDDQMILASLAEGYEDTTLVPDAELAGWGVITVAARPEQYLPMTDGLLSYCNSPTLPEGIDVDAFGWLCNELDLSRSYRAIELLLLDLANEPSAEKDLGQQARFEAAWQDCARLPEDDAALSLLAATVTAPDRRVPDCIGAAITARRDQLQALSDYLRVVRHIPASSGWTDGG